jgi:surface protein
MNGMITTTPQRLKLRSIKQWGNQVWASMQSSFAGCSNLNYNTTTDTPNLTNVTDMSFMFDGCDIFNGDIGSWNTSNITNMNGMFRGAHAFNKPIGNWNTSNVTNMNDMFNSAFTFNQPINFNPIIGSWNTSNVTNMGSMFISAHSFNQPLNNWDTGNVINMIAMFVGAYSFNQNLGNWDVTKVSDMSYMLNSSGLSTANYDATLISWAGQNVKPNVHLGASGLKYCLGQTARNYLTSTKGWQITWDSYQCSPPSSPFITTWVTNDGKITIPTFLGISYNYSVTYKQIAPTTGSIITITGQTGNCTISGLTNGNTYEVKISGQFPRFYMNNNNTERGKLRTIEQWGNNTWASMESAFAGCGNLTYNATDIPNLSNITNMSAMFYDCTIFNGNIENWNVINVTNMSQMFKGATVFNQPLNNWNTINVTNMSEMFQNASNFNQPLYYWKTDNVLNMSAMFMNATAFNQALKFRTHNVTNMSLMFYNATSFNQSLGEFKISNVINMMNMLSNSGLSMENYDDTLIGWASQSIQYNVPFGAQGLEYCAGVRAREFLLKYSWIIDGDIYACKVAFITTWQTGEKMFTIPTFPGLTYDYKVRYRQISPTLGNFISIPFQTGDCTIYPADPNSVYEVHITGTFPHFYMGVNSPERNKLLTIEQWGTQQWSSMESAFRGCEKLISLATDTPDLSNVTDLSFMFDGCISLKGTLGDWNTSSIIYMNNMFTNAKSFNQNLGNWNVENVVDMRFMLDNTVILKANYDQTLISWSQQNVQQNVILGSVGLNYCNAVNERADLINNYGWVILGDNLNCLAARPAGVVGVDTPSETITKKISDKVNVYPNPSEGNFNIELEKTANQVPYKVYNAQGVEVLKGILENSNTHLKTNLASGVYFIHILENRKPTIKKMVVR